MAMVMDLKASSHHNLQKTFSDLQRSLISLWERVPRFIDLVIIDLVMQ
jgi:hypothetical protein